MDRKTPDARGFRRVLAPEKFYLKSNRMAMVTNGQKVGEQEITGPREKWQSDLSQLGMEGKVSWDLQRRKLGLVKLRNWGRSGQRVGSTRPSRCRPSCRSQHSSKVAWTLFCSPGLVRNPKARLENSLAVELYEAMTSCD